MPFKLIRERFNLSQWNYVSMFLIASWYVLWGAEIQKLSLVRSVLVTIGVHAAIVAPVGLIYHILLQRFAKYPNHDGVILGYWVGNVLHGAFFVSLLTLLLMITEWWFVGLFIGIVQGYFLSIPLSIAVMQLRLPEPND